MKKDDKVEMTPSEYYKDLMMCILEVGDIYSSFVELVLAHLFLVENNEFWRYNQDKAIVVKLSEKTVASKISKLLGFLFQPNKITINEVDDETIDASSIDLDKLSFHERVFLQQL